MALTITPRLVTQTVLTKLDSAAAVTMTADGQIAVWGLDGDSTDIQMFGADGLPNSYNVSNFSGTPGQMITLADGSFVQTGTLNGSGMVLLDSNLNVTFAGANPLSNFAGNLAALPDGRFVSYGISGSTFFIAILDRFASAPIADQSGSLSLPSGSSDPAVAVLDNGNIAVVWTQTLGGATQLFRAVFDADLNRIAAPLAVDNTGSINRNAAIVAIDNGFAVAYEDNDSGNTGVSVIYFDQAGTKGEKFLFDTDTGAESDITMARLGDQFAVAYANAGGQTTTTVQFLTEDQSDLTPSTGVVNLSSFGVGTALSEALSPKLTVVDETTLAVVTNNSLLDHAVLSLISTDGLNVIGPSNDAEPDVYFATEKAERIDFGSFNSNVDTLSYVNSTAGVFVNLSSSASASPSRGGFAEGDTFGSSGTATPEILIGSNFDDRLFGNFGTALIGGLGNDTLRGGGSAIDSLTGGAGRDVMFGGPDTITGDDFIYLAVSESRVGANHDVIRDFTSGMDDLDLSAIDANSNRAGNQAFTFGGSTPGNFKVWQVDAGRDLLVQGDVNGDGRADFEILLRNTASVVADDFIL